ncbi:MAG TPA: hypothetical protein VJQ61_02900, partial [Sinomonas sp.]|nr:hypothetical protein [Sinomonas sp.]
LDEDRTVCLISVEPVSAHTHLIFKPGTVGPVDRGAAVMGIYSGMPPSAAEYPDAAEARRRGYAWSTGQITPGIECVAAPIRLPTSPTPASVAVIYPVGSRVVEQVAAEVHSATTRINALFDTGESDDTSSRPGMSGASDGGARSPMRAVRQQ